MKLGNKVAKLTTGTITRQTHRSTPVTQIAVAPVIEPPKVEVKKARKSYAKYK